MSYTNWINWISKTYIAKRGVIGDIHQILKQSIWQMIYLKILLSQNYSKRREYSLTHFFWFVFQFCDGNFMCQLGWVTRWLDRFLFKHICVCLWGCFWVRLAFELVNWVKQRAAFHMNGHQPIHGGPESKKKVKKVELKLCLTVWIGTWSSAFHVLIPRISDLNWNLH